MWSGRDGAATASHVEELNAARDRGVSAVEAIARLEAAGDAAREQRALVYLRDNLKYGLGEAAIAGLRRFHELAVELGLAPGVRELRFF
jgi:predicted solute-binding protein